MDVPFFLLSIGFDACEDTEGRKGRLRQFAPLYYYWRVEFSSDRAQSPSHHVRVHANLIEGFWELALALPRDNPWRNDPWHSA